MIEYVPVVWENWYGIYYHHAHICNEYRTPSCNMSNQYPTLDVHGQVNIHKNNNRNSPQTAHTPDIDWTVSVCEERYIKKNKTLPQSIKHCDPEEVQIIALLSISCSIKFWITEESFMAQVLVQNTNNYCRNRCIDDRVEYTAPISHSWNCWKCCT